MRWQQQKEEEATLRRGRRTFKGAGAHDFQFLGDARAPGLLLQTRCFRILGPAKGKTKECASLCRVAVLGSRGNLFWKEASALVFFFFSAWGKKIFNFLEQEIFHLSNRSNTPCT